MSLFKSTILHIASKVVNECYFKAHSAKVRLTLLGQSHENELICQIMNRLRLENSAKRRPPTCRKYPFQEFVQNLYDSIVTKYFNHFLRDFLNTIFVNLFIFSE